jgi:hypothetical protein
MAQRKDKAIGFPTSGGTPFWNDRQWEAIQRRFWRAVERIRMRNSAADPDEVLREVTEVVEEVRTERYGRTRQAQGGR